MESFLYVIYVSPGIMNSPSLKNIENKVSLPSVMICGTSHQQKFSLDVGVSRPEGFYVYRARLVEGSITPPYRPIRWEGKPTSIITPQYLDGMLAEIVHLYFDERIEPLQLVSDMNWGLHQQLYRSLTRS